MGPLLAVACYNLRFNAPISQQTVVALLQTTAFEVQEFVLSYADVRVVALIAVLMLVVLALGVAQHRAGRADIRGRACAAIAIVALAQFVCAYKQLNLDKTITGTRSRYNADLATLRMMQALRKMAVAEVVAHKQGRGELYVLVVGESQLKDHLSVYGYSRQTTPWLDAQMNQPNWLRFDRAYSNAVQTVPALSLALTAANQYNGKSYFESVSILDVAAAAGFRTYWLSNQRGLGRNDNAISAIAATAGFYENLGDVQGPHGRSDAFGDAQLVERFKALKEKIDPNENNLVVFHLLGSHEAYCRRFPLAFARFGPQAPASAQSDGVSDRLRAGAIPASVVDCYDNSVAFTDLVLSQIHAEAARWPGFNGLVYVPDHGEAVGIGHDPQLFSFPMARIPLLVWLSDQYMAREPQRAMALRDNTSKVWTNDLLYDLLVGLMGIEVDAYNARYDLSSSSYRLDPEQALTLHGRRQVMEDPGFAFTGTVGR
jgi:heptose-I-phosphate ethanolaminephosphotransferase